MWCHLMNTDVTIVHCFVIFYHFLISFLTFTFFSSNYERFCSPNKRIFFFWLNKNYCYMNYCYLTCTNKEVTLIYDITITYLIITFFWTFKFCWKMSLKNADTNILELYKWIVCLIYPLYNLLFSLSFNTMHFER